MPTNNPKISAYVPQAVYDRFKEFQQKQELSMSQAVIVIFTEYFGLQQVIKETARKSTIGGVTLDRFRALEALVLELSDKVKSLQLASVPSSSRDDSAAVPGQMELFDGERSDLLVENKISKIEIKPLAGNKLSTLRFGISKDAVSGAKRKMSTEEFTRWTSDHDPDGIAWQWVENPSKGYIPVNETPSEVLSELKNWIGKNI